MQTDNGCSAGTDLSKICIIYIYICVCDVYVHTAVSLVTNQY